MRRRGETFGGVCDEAVLAGCGINVIFVGKMLLPMVLTARMGYNEKKIAMGGTRMGISPHKLATALGLRTISTAGKEMEESIDQADLCRPGLQFAGYFDVFAFERPQVIGKTEMAYLGSLPPNVLDERLTRYFSYHIPCIIIARSMQCPPALLERAQENDVPVYGADEETSIFSAKAITFLSEALAPRQTCHGVLMDVYGVGLMITGESGVGKSECALELIKHGHQLVTDDVVDISRVGRTLYGESPEMVRDFIELRGIGIVDVKEIFGIGAIVRRIRIDLVINLETWHEGKDYDRLGNRERTMDILGVPLPLIEVPVRPGRSLSTIVEIAARNWRLKAEGYDAVVELDRRLAQHYGRMNE